MAKLYDLAVKTDTYTDSNGEQKNKWQNVGAVMQGKDGGQFILLEKWFNPAGIADPEGRSNVMLSCFEPRQAGQQQGQQQNQQQAPQQNQGFQGQQQAPQQGFQGQQQGGYNNNPQR